MLQSETIRTQLADLEQRTLPACIERAETTALAAYKAPDDADLKRDADQAMGSLRDCHDRLAQLRLAVVAAERAEAAAIEQRAEDERRRSRDRLIRHAEKRRKLAAVHAEKYDAALARRPDAEAALEAAARAYREAQAALDTIDAKLANHGEERARLTAEADALDTEAADTPVTAAECAAKIERERLEQERLERDRIAAEEQDRRLAELRERERQEKLRLQEEAAAKERYDNEEIEVPCRYFLCGRGVFAAVARYHWPKDHMRWIKRRDLAAFQAEQAALKARFAKQTGAHEPPATGRDRAPRDYAFYPERRSRDDQPTYDELRASGQIEPEPVDRTTSELLAAVERARQQMLHDQEHRPDIRAPLP